jgi:hypothetical protein
MAATSGTAGSVVYMTGGTTLVGEIAEWRMDFTMSPVETTAFGQAWNTHIPSTRGATGSFSGNFDPANGAQGSVVAAMLGGSAVALRLYVNTTKYFNVGTAYINSMGPGISQKGKGDIQFGFTASDTVTLV